jgi:CubicO group peptidase (beta-lactamase class C family)
MTQFEQSAISRIRETVAEAIAGHHLPGVSIGVVSGDNLVYAEGFGYADIESREPMDPGRHQRIASITKTMTGLCTMALVDEGRLSLSGRVVDYLPEIAFDGPAARMTVHHLLTHTSGIGEAPTADALAETVDPNHAGGEGGFSTMYADGIIVEAEPGTKRAYANHGYALLGEIIARAEDAPFADVLQRRVFEPLGMRDTTCTREVHTRATTGYHRAPNDDTRELLERAGRPVPHEETVDGHNVRGKAVANDHHGMLAAGAVQSTMPDMARYAAALLRRGGGIVRPETFDAMVAPQWCPDDRLVSWGLSFSRWRRAGRRAFGHGGAYFGGWNSNLAVLPEEGLALIVHMNVMLDSPGPIFARLQRAVLGAPAPAIPDAPVDEDVLASAPGVYECTPGRLTNFRPSTNLGRVQITRDGTALTIRSRRGAWKQGVLLVGSGEQDPLLLAALAPDSDPATVLLTRDATGRIDGLSCDELVHMVRNESLQPWA